MKIRELINAIFAADTVSTPLDPIEITEAGVRFPPTNFRVSRVENNMIQITGELPADGLDIRIHNSRRQTEPMHIEGTHDIALHGFNCSLGAESRLMLAWPIYVTPTEVQFLHTEVFRQDSRILSQSQEITSTAMFTY